MKISTVARSGWRVIAALAGGAGLLVMLAYGQHPDTATDVSPEPSGLPGSTSPSTPAGMATGTHVSQQMPASSSPVRIRDSSTGASLAGVLTEQSLVNAGAARATALARAGTAVAALGSGAGSVSMLTAEADGYQALATYTQAGVPGLPITFWLQPVRQPPMLDNAALRALACRDCAVVSGHVYDHVSGQPLADIKVAAGNAASTRTNGAGRFELVLRAQQPNLSDAQARPETMTLTFQGNGYAGQLEQVSLYNDAQELIIDLDKSRPGMRIDIAQGVAQQGTHAVRAQDAQVESAVSADQDKILRADDTTGQALASRLSTQPATIPVPASIKVGTGCSGRACSGVSVYGFEDYVGRGLDNEWIASWDPDSLAAGAIAYRSYAAYYVAHPVNSRYDICSSTSCQVFGSGAVAATVAAAAATRGVVLTRDGQTAAFAEYSAENNAWDNPTDGLSCSNADLSCGNGFNGSPSKGWPCLSDSVGNGRGCFGHGRGMSQWGTQRWAANQGRDWKWIADHYFNNNGRAAGMRNAFLANVSQGNVQMLDNFENGVGHFGTIPTYSGSTVGIAASSTAGSNCSTRHGGRCSLNVRLVDNPVSAANWQVRLLSAVGNPAANTPLARSGSVGMWVYAGGTGLTVAIGIDDGDGTERSIARSVPANSWTWVQWSLADDAQWSAWSGGNGRIDAQAPTLDAVWLLHANTGYNLNVYLDDLQLRR